MARKKKQDFTAYVTNVLQNSMLTGIPQIATAGNWPKRLVRTFVFFMCLAGFIYQSLSFMNVFWEYDVVMDVKIENPDYAVRPSFTVCNQLGFKVQEFCEDQDKPEIQKIIKDKRARCFEIEDRQKSHANFCTCNPRLCDSYGRLKYNYSMELLRLTELPRDQLKKWLLTPEEIIGKCEDVKMKQIGLDNCSDPYYLEPACQLNKGEPESCVTVNSLIGRPSHTLEEVFTDSEIRLDLNMHDENYPEDFLDPFTAISIHNPYTIINPLKHGFALQNQMVYIFRLKRVIRRLLPPPYKTNCMDYRSLWYARGGRGPTNFPECMQECQLNLSLAKHGCVTEEIYSPSEEIRCLNNFTDPTLFLEAIKCADENCKPACFEEYYIIEQDCYKNAPSECDVRNYTEATTSAYIHLNGMETTIYTYSPKYQDIEAFSYLGGYVGMWLGISLVAVFDFLETMIVMLKYPYRRWIRFKERRRKIREMEKLLRKR